MKNTAESENLNYILVNTKPCPKCRRPIEKNQARRRLKGYLLNRSVFSGMHAHDMQSVSF